MDSRLATSADTELGDMWAYDPRYRGHGWGKIALWGRPIRAPGPRRGRRDPRLGGLLDVRWPASVTRPGRDLAVSTRSPARGQQPSGGSSGARVTVTDGVRQLGRGDGPLWWLRFGRQPRLGDTWVYGAAQATASRDPVPGAPDSPVSGHPGAQTCFHTALWHILGRSEG